MAVNIGERVVYYDGSYPAYMRSYERGVWVRSDDGYKWLNEGDTLYAGKKAMWQQVFVPVLHVGGMTMRPAKVVRFKTATQAREYYERTKKLGNQRYKVAAGLV